jgi:hypothetical protein
MKNKQKELRKKIEEAQRLLGICMLDGNYTLPKYYRNSKPQKKLRKNRQPKSSNSQ